MILWHATRLMKKRRVRMDTEELGEFNKTNKNTWADKILSLADLLPTSLVYMLIFAAATFVGSAATYYINPAGLLCGVLAVLIYRWK
jgi:hypothetical protein